MNILGQQKGEYWDKQSGTLGILESRDKHEYNIAAFNNFGPRPQIPVVISQLLRRIQYLQSGLTL